MKKNKPFANWLAALSPAFSGVSPFPIDVQNFSEKFLLTSETAGDKSEEDATVANGAKKNVIAIRQASDKRFILPF